jgi:hypothetical protein
MRKDILTCGFRKMARKTKYTPERVEVILGAISEGMTYRLAAAAAGISDDTLTIWKARHSDFSERLMAVEAEAALKAMKRINRAANDDWRAAAWILEHRHPEDYGKLLTRAEVVGDPNNPLVIRSMSVPLPVSEERDR